MHVLCGQHYVEQLLTRIRRAGQYDSINITIHSITGSLLGHRYDQCDQNSGVHTGNHMGLGSIVIGFLLCIIINNFVTPWNPQLNNMYTLCITKLLQYYINYQVLYLHKSPVNKSDLTESVEFIL